MSDQYPRLRRDLVVSRQETPEGPCFVLKDPRTRRFYRLREAEYAVARRLDGLASLESVAQQVAVELGVEATAAELAPFVAQLRSRELLETDAVSPAGARRSHFQGNLLWLRLKAFDPDRLFDRLVGKVRFCFTPYFVAASAALIAWAFVTGLLNREEIRADLVRLWSFQSLLLAWVTVFAVTTLHECAHGLTCKRFGGHVHEMGFLLIYLQPAFYCNISDAWLFPEKSKRLWVTFAGGYFELVLWALATLVWRVTERQTWLSGAALVVMATSGIKLFINLNPLIKLDGYYLLSDWLEIPNLRARAFGYVGSRLKRLLGLPAPPDGPEPTARERRIFLGYGATAAAFSYWLLSVVLWRLAGYFTWRWQGWGAALSVGLFAMVLGSVMGRPLVRWPAALSLRNHRVRLLGVAGAALLLLWLIRVPLTAGGEFTVAPGQNADVRAEVEGIIDRVYVDEGQPVAAGDTLAHLSERDYRARLRMVETEIAGKRATLRLLAAGRRAEEVEIARLSRDQAEELLRYAETEVARTRALAATQAASREELERAEESLSVRRRQRDAARTQLQLVTAGTRPESLVAMREDLARSEAEGRHAADQLAKVWITAPHAGFVTTPKPRERIGEYVKAGDLVVQVYDIKTVTAEIAVSERDIGDVRIGQRGAVRLRAYPDRAFQGRVTAIAPVAAAPPDQRGRIVKVTVELPNPDDLIKPQMTGYARIYCGERRALDVLTRRFRRFLRVEFWSWW